MNAKYCEFSFGDKKILALTEKAGNNEVYAYELKKVLEGKPQAPCLIRMSGITQISWGNLNKYLYASTAKGNMRTYMASNGSEELTKKVHNAEIVSFTFSPDRIFLFTASRDETYCMLDPDNLEILQQYNFRGNFVRAIAISPLYRPDSKPIQRYHILVGGGQDEKEVTTTGKKGGFEIRIVNYVTSEELAEVKGHFGPIHSLVFNPDGRSFASGSEDGYIRLHFLQSEYYSPKFE